MKERMFGLCRGCLQVQSRSILRSHVSVLRRGSPVVRVGLRCYTSRNILHLHERGILNDIFPPKQNDLISMLERSAQVVYCGFDPTAPSLHIGNLLSIMTLLHCQRAGHHVIAVVGGATCHIGDPSGKNSERPQMSSEAIRTNTSNITKIIRNIFNNHEQLFWKNMGYKDPLHPVRIVDNMSWYSGTNVVDFLSTCGRGLRVGPMLGRTAVKLRLEAGDGISYGEFSYQAAQAYDWLQLHDRYGCNIQIGGSDQMGNIMTGHDLITKLREKHVFGLTTPLVLSESGHKLGKTSPSGALWLDAAHSTEFDFYQFLVRTPDSIVQQYLQYFTFHSIENIQGIMDKHKANSKVWHAQKKLAEQLTLLIHGESGLASALRATSALYSTDISSLLQLSADEITNIFSTATVSHLQLQEDMSVLDLALQAQCFNSPEEAMRIICAGGFYLNHQRVTIADTVLLQGEHIMPNNITLARKGKRNYHIIRWV